MEALQGFAGAVVGGLIVGVLNWFLQDKQHKYALELQDNQFKFESAERKSQRWAESQRKAISDLQDACGLLADATNTARTMRTFYMEKPSVEERLAIIKEQWFQDWQAGTRQVGVLAHRVDDPVLTERAYAVRDIALSYESFVFHHTNPDVREEHGERLDQALSELNELAGRLYRELDAAI
jgi:hypothetical protein